MGWVTGIEPNARLRALAASRAENNGVPNVSFIDGFAGALPFEDSSVDLVWCERVLQHLNDPQAAIDDIARVLRPGGRAVLLDADQGTRIMSDLDPESCLRIHPRVADGGRQPVRSSTHSRASPQGWTRTRSGRGLVRLRLLVRDVAAHPGSCSGRPMTPSNPESSLVMSLRPSCGQCTPLPNVATHSLRSLFSASSRASSTLEVSVVQREENRGRPR